MFWSKILIFSQTLKIRNCYFFLIFRSVFCTAGYRVELRMRNMRWKLEKLLEIDPKLAQNTQKSIFLLIFDCLVSLFLLCFPVFFQELNSPPRGRLWPEYLPLFIHFLCKKVSLMSLEK